jgi:ABC-type branched-subunit amino acid transport system permease subunit
VSTAAVARSAAPPRADRVAARAPKRPPSLWWAVAGWVAVPCLVAALAHDRFVSATLAAAAVQGLFAVSWVPLAVTGQPSFGHALPYGAGAYAAAFVARRAGLHAGNLGGMAPVVLTVTAALAGGCFGGLQGRLTRRLAPAYVAAVTLATVEAARSLAAMWTAPVLRGGGDTDTAIPIMTFPNDDRTAAWLAAAAFAAGVLIVAALVRSRTGVALRAAAGGEREADALGFDAPRLRLFAFVAAGTIAGVAGALAAQLSGRVSPLMLSWQASLFVPAAALIGGAGTVAGPAAAAYVGAAVAQFFEVPAALQLLVFAAVLIAAGLRDPQHLLGPAFSWNPRPGRPRPVAPRDRS